LIDRKKQITIIQPRIIRFRQNLAQGLILSQPMHYKY